jgi:hypothetical protein
MAGEHLDLTSDFNAGPAGSKPSRRPYLGIHFACCGVYAQISLNRDETAYLGRCPRCLKQVRVEIGPGGTDSRFFTAY